MGNNNTITISKTLTVERLSGTCKNVLQSMVFAIFFASGFAMYPSFVRAQSVTEIIRVGLVNPQRVAVDVDGNAYVVSTNSNKAYKITPTGIVTEILDFTGDSIGHALVNPIGIAVDMSGNVFVAGLGSNNVFKITPGGAVSVILDSTGDGGGNTLSFPESVTIDDSGNVYVAGVFSQNVFKVTPGGAITQIINTTGDGGGNVLLYPSSIAVDTSDNVYVSGKLSQNAFKITSGGIITQIIDSTGDGGGNTLSAPSGIDTDSSDNVFVIGTDSSNAFKITSGGTITEIIDSTGDGGGNELISPQGIVVDATDNIFVAGTGSSNAFKITSVGVISEIIDSSGDGGGHELASPIGIAADPLGNVFVSCSGSNNAFKITTGSVISQIIDSTGEGDGNIILHPSGIAVDVSNNVFVTGINSENVFKIASDGMTSKIIDVTGDGGGNSLSSPQGIDVNASGVVYVTGNSSNNAFKITPGGEITKIIDAAGDGGGTNLSSPVGIAVDASENAFVAASGGNNVFKITSLGAISEIIDSNGDNIGNTLGSPKSITADEAGNVYVAGSSSNNAFKIEPGGTITEIIDSTGDGNGNILTNPSSIAVDETGNVYLTGQGSKNAFKIAPGGTITEIIDSTGDGNGNTLNAPDGIAVDIQGNVYVIGATSDNAFKITPSGVITELIDANGDGNGKLLVNPTGIAVDSMGYVYVAGNLSNNAFRIEPGNVILYVDVNATGFGNGSDWANAYTNLQDALSKANSRNTDGNSANDISEIWVAAGTYHPDEKSCFFDIDCDGPDGGTCSAGVCVWTSPRKQTFQLLSNVAIYGGFVGNESLLTERDIEANITILSGDIGDDDALQACTLDSPDCDSNGGKCLESGFCVASNNISENSYHVTTGSNTDTTAQLDGFDITAGNADDLTFPHDKGAGMFNNSGSPRVANCTFIGNSANGNSSAGGGGIYNFNAISPLITNCSFIANWANIGGALYNVSSNPMIENCNFSKNSVATLGGGIFNIGSTSDTSFVDCSFSQNRAQRGGGIYNDQSSPIVIQGLFDRNSAEESGGGIYNHDGSHAQMTNCQFIGNNADTFFGGGICNVVNSSPALMNCLFSGNFALVAGGAIYNNDTSSPVLNNCSLTLNAALTSGGGMHNANGNPTIDNSIFWNNTDAGGSDESAQIHNDTGTPVVKYSIVQGGWTGAGGTGNLSSDPSFVDADGADNVAGTQDDDLRLQSSSLAIDSGDNTVVPADTQDLDDDLNTIESTPLDLLLNPRFIDDAGSLDTGNAGPPGPSDKIVDMGAIEFQGIIFVDADAIGANNGSSWANAYNYLQDALTDASASPQDIWVATGTYKPDQGGGVSPGDRSATFHLINNVTIYGGFAGGESQFSQRNVEANKTILSGDLLDNDVAIACTNDSPDCGSFGERCLDSGFCIIKQNIADNSYSIATGTGTDSTAGLNGFTISGGNAGEPCCVVGDDTAGGGLYNNPSGSPTITDCIFTGNKAVWGGGISSWSSSSPTITRCTFYENYASYGAGVHNETTSDSTITDCSFIENMAQDGGGMFNINAAPTITRCQFINNIATIDGGGAVNGVSANAIFTNCSFWNNSAINGGGVFTRDTSSPVFVNCMWDANTANTGGGMQNDSSSSPEVTNCTFSGNSATTSGGGVYNGPTGVNNLIMSNSILWLNNDSGGTDESAQIHTDSGTPLVNYSIIQGGWSGAGGAGIVSTDPMLIDPDGEDDIVGTLDDDLRLLPNSPAIDAGDNTVVPTDTFDLDGDLDTAESTSLDLSGYLRFRDDINVVDTGMAGPPGPVDEIVDLGAYENQPASIEMVLAPARASGPYSIEGNTITLHESGQRIFFEVHYSGWSPELLKSWTIKVDSTGYDNGAGDSLDPAVENCASDADCVAAFGAGATCDLAGISVTGINTCFPAFFEENRTDDIPFASGGPFGVRHVDATTKDFELGGLIDMAEFSKTDPGISVYGGTIVLDAPVDALNIYTIGFDAGSGTSAQASDDSYILPILTSAVVITPDCNNNGIPDDQDIAGGSDDCDGNQVPDECDIADCNGDPDCDDCDSNGILDICDLNDCAGSADCDDCNLNNVMDFCDITNATSTDSNFDNIPDECVATQTGTGNWTDNLVWGFASAGEYPDNQDSIPGLHVTIAAAIITLDTTVEVDSLQINSDGTLLVTQSGADLLIANPDFAPLESYGSGPGATTTGTGSDIFVSTVLDPILPDTDIRSLPDAAVQNDGTVIVANDTTIGNLGQPIEITGGAVYMADPNIDENTTGTGCNDGSFVCTTLEGSTISIIDDKQCTEPGGEVALEGSMTVHASVDYNIIGNQECSESLCAAGASVAGGRTPPVTTVRDQSLLTINNTFLLLGDLYYSNDSTENVLIGCNFDNGSTRSECFDSENGGITMCRGDRQCYCPAGDSCADCNPGNNSNMQYFEVASQDMGSTFDGFGNSADSNFSLGRLQIGTDSTSSFGTHIEFVNKYDNTVGSNDFQEALYVHDLVIKDGSTVTMRKARVYYENITIGENVTIEGAENLISVTCGKEAPLADPSGLLRNRYLSLQPGNGGVNVAIRVRMVDLDGFPSFNDEVRWAGAPGEYQDIAVPDPLYWASPLQCTPYYQDWGSIDFLHLYGREVVPGSTYEVQVIREDCSLGIDDENAYSDSITLRTGKWGDVFSPFDGEGSLQPSISDVLKLVDKWLGSVVPAKVQTQLQPDLIDPNNLISVSDILKCVDAWLGSMYPFEGPQSCPP